jgi:hypothetical protein
VIRLKILKVPPVGDIDGIRLDLFERGQEYDVGNTLAALLLAEGWAEPVPLDAPKPFEPFTKEDPFDARVLDRRSIDLVREVHSRKVHSREVHSRGAPRAKAADHTRKRRRS